MSRNAVREQGGIEQLIALLKKQEASTELAAASLLAITVLVTESEINQEHVRQAHGLSCIVKYLDARVGAETALAAVLCLTGPPHRSSQEEPEIY